MSDRLALDLEECRELRQILKSFVQTCGDPTSPRPGQPGYRCRYCFGMGAWPSEIAHGNHAGDPNGRPCRVVRARVLLDTLQAWIGSQENHSGDSPVIGK